MSIINVIKNELNAVIGYRQRFEDLVATNDISRAISCMEDRSKEVDESIKQYDVSTHDIMQRKDKPIYDKNGAFLRYEKQWRLPIPYQAFINEISLIFLYGRPVKWIQNSENTDNAFNAYTSLLQKIRFDSRIRQAKRLAGAETESAILFRVFRNEANEPDCQAKVLARSLGDDLRFIWDEYGNLLAAGWGYYTKTDTSSVYNFVIYTQKYEYKCTRNSALTGWTVEPRENLIGKIPIILFRQEAEHTKVQKMIEREEWIGSRTADVNDYFADPIAVMSASAIKNMPDKKEASKLLIVDGDKGVENAVKYLTWDSASESKENELKWLEKHILTKSFTPNFDYESLKGISNMSGKALQQMMLLADIKANKHKEIHDELLDRIASLCKSIIANVLSVQLKSEIEKLEVKHEFQAPFVDDIKQTVETLAKAYETGGISLETYVERNPLVSDSQTELKRIKEEAAEKAKMESDVFGQGF